MPVTAFVRFCLDGLRTMYSPAEHLFPAYFRLADGALVHARNRAHEYRFIMNALAGLHRARAAGCELFLDPEADYRLAGSRVAEMSGSPQDVAATVWTGKEIGACVPEEASSLFRAIVDEAGGRARLSAKALSWSIIACLAGRAPDVDRASALARLAVARYLDRSTSLVREAPGGLRRDWASFGAHSYMAYAFLLLARAAGSESARDVGISILRALVERQGPQGQWYWMYHVPSGRVAEAYPVFSVHQYAYAPLGFLEALELGYHEFRRPLRRGFQWVTGHNELGQTMVDRNHRVVWRSIVRKPPNHKLVKVARGAAAVYLGTSPVPRRPDRVCLLRECWSFEMALGLYAFSGRSGFDDLVEDPCFG